MSSEPHSDCPSVDHLRALAEGRLNQVEASACEEHLTSCAGCQKKLEVITGFEDFFAADGARAVGEKSQVLTGLMEHLASSPHISPVETRVGSPLDFLGPAESPEHLGRLGQYVVIEEIARGGTGIVLKAIDTELQRTVAIKLLSPELASKPGARERFLEEARAAAKLEHDNIMPIYSVDQTGPIPYIVVPFVDGPNLQQRIDEEGPFDVVETTRIAFDVCQALEAAHTQGIVHRDVKPANIMVDDERHRVWLADFGLARAADDPQQVQKGLIAGTPSYMAPEQASTESVDYRADLFSLGCVVYAMLTGNSPFQADSARESIEKIKHYEPVSLKSAAFGIPEWLSALVKRLLKKDPFERPNSAAEVRDIVAKHLPGHSWLHPRTQLALALVTSTGLVAALFFALRTPPPAEEGKGFLISGREELYTGLTEAIDAATSGDTIVVRGSDEFTVGLTSIRDKALTIQAEAGSQPVFIANSVRTAILQSDAPLCVEGITFEHPDSISPLGALPQLRTRGAPLFVVNCRFDRPTVHELVAPIRLPSIIEIRDGSQVDIVNCEFRTGAGRLIVINHSDPGFENKTRLENNLIVGQIGVFFEASADGRYQWELERNTIVAAAGFFVRSLRAGLPQGKVTVQGNVFEFRNSLLILGARQSRLETNVVTLSGGDNLFRKMNSPDGTGSRVRYVAPRWARSSGSIDSFEEFSAAMGTVGREVAEPLFALRRGGEEKSHASLEGPSEQFRLDEAYANERSRTGCDLGKVGPGVKFDAWRGTDSYATWKERIRRGMQQR